MKTFRQLIGNINKIKNPKDQSPLESWFESVLDVPLEKLEVGDLCRAVRQKVCISQLMPLILDVMIEDPLAGDLYDGELIAALATLKEMELIFHKEEFIKIKEIIKKIDLNNVDTEVKVEAIKIINMPI